MPVLISTGQITIVDTNDGLSTQLSSNSFLVPADKDGNVNSYTGAETTFTIYEAGVDMSTKWGFYVSASGGGITYRDVNDAANRSDLGPSNGVLDTNYLKITSLTQASSYLDITATRSGQQNITRRFSVAKAVVGATGTRGTLTVSRAISGASWVDSEALAAISGIGGGSPIRGDTVTLYRASPAYSETRVFNGSAWVSQAAYIAGSQIIDNSVSGAKIVTDSITALQIGANVITTNKLAIADFTNYAANGDLSLGNKGWNNLVVTDATNALVGSNVIVLNPSATVQKYGSNENVFSVKAGDTFYLEWYGKATSDMDGSFNIYVRINNAAGSQIATQNVGSISSANTSYALKSGVITIPATGHHAYIQINYSNTVGTGYIGGVRMRRRNEGTLIVDGTITGNKIAANTISTNTLTVTSRPFSTIGLNFRIDADGVLRWDAGTVQYQDSNGSLNQRAIVAGSSAWASATKYVSLYVADGASNTNLDALNNNSLVNNSNYLLIAIWEGGSALNVMGGVGTIINGDRIVTGTIKADKIVGKSITGAQIAGETITGDKIVGGTIQAAQIGAGAILASKLAVGNTDNVIPDADMRELTFWTGDNPPAGMFVNDQNSGWTFRRYLGLSAIGSFDRFGRLFPVEPGATYKIKVGMYIGGDMKGWFNPVIHIPNVQWLSLKTGQSMDPSAANATNGFVDQNYDVRSVEFTYTNPTGITDNSNRNWQFRFMGNMTAGYVEFMVSITRVSDATLIADGAITTKKITVNTLSGDVIETGTLNANKIAADSVMSNFVRVSGTNGNIGDAILRAEDPAKRINEFETHIKPGLILVQGSTSLNDWRDGTEIRGGAIKANSILASKLNINQRGINTENIDFEVRLDRSSTELCWNGGGYIQYMDDNGTAQSRQIAAGSTYGVTKRCFVYWVVGETAFRVGTNAEAIMADTSAVMIGTYMGGTIYSIHYGGTIINGDRITTGTIDAGKIKAGSILAGTVTVSGVSGTNTIADAFATATWANVSGTGKPSDNATVGAPDDTYVGSGANKFLAQDLATGVANIASDNVLSKNEKSDAIRDWSRASTNYQAFTSQATTLAVDYTAYTTAYNALASYLGGLSPQWNQVTSDTPIVGDTYRQKWYDYTLQEGRLLAALDAKTATLSTWAGTTGAGKPETYTVCARGNNTATNTLPATYAHGLRGSAGQVFVDTFHSSLRTDMYARSYTVAWRGNANYWAVRSFDVYGNGSVTYADDQNRNGGAGMVSLLNSLSNGTPVVIYTSDEPATNRLNNGLPAAIYACGGSRAEFGSPTFATTGAYILIGQKGIGENNGLEFRCGSGASIMTSFSIVNGVPTFGGKTLKDAQDISYSDGKSVNSLQPADAAATKGAPAGTSINGVAVETITSAVAAITDDNIVSPAEKTALKNQYEDVLASESYTYSRLTAYVDAQKGQRWEAEANRNAMSAAKNTVISTLAGVFDNMNTPATVAGAGIREAFRTYYDRLAKAQISLQQLAAESADFDLVTGANRPENGATKGAPIGTKVGGIEVQTLVNNINAITDDNIVSPSEKTALLNQYNSILQDENKTWLRLTEYVNVGKGGKYDCQTKRDAMSAAKDEVGNALGTTFTDMSAPTNVNGANLRNAFAGFYNRLAEAQIALQYLGAESSDWQEVYGTGKPANNAGTTVEFGLYGPESGDIVIAGNTLTRKAGNGNWKVFAYTREVYTGSSYISGRLEGRQSSFGLSTQAAPTTDDYNYIVDFRIHWSNDGNWYAGELGTWIPLGTGQAGVTFNATTMWQLTYDGIYVRYYADGALFRTTATTANRQFQGRVLLGGTPGKVSNLQFGVFVDNSLVNADPADRINRNQTEISGGKIKTGTIDAGKINVDNLAAIKADLGTITAGTIRNASGSTNFDVSAGRITFDNGSVMRVMGNGFGSSNQFIEWFGPKQSSLSNCTEANAKQFLKTNGDAYFGGTLSGGITKNAVNTTSIANNASVTTGQVGSRGGSRVVVVGYSWNQIVAVNKTQQPSSGGGLSARVILQRNGQDVMTLDATGTWERTFASSDNEPGTYSEAMGGSITYTDNSGGDKVTYSAYLSFRNLGPGAQNGTNREPTYTQRIDIVQTEQ